jgi:hypothetical protein
VIGGRSALAAGTAAHERGVSVLRQKHPASPAEDEELAGEGLDEWLGAPGDDPEPASVEDLAVAQGVARADDLAAIAADWPVDDDPEALDAYLRARRRECRSATLGTRG